MKKVLSLLMIFVFLNATVWAYAPDYSGSGTVQDLTGTYAGVFIPTVANTKLGGTSLGVFAIGIPGLAAASVISQGAGVLFANGAGYNLNITGTFDPKTATLSAIIFGESNFEIIETSVVGGTAVTTTFFISAEGSMTGKIEANSGNSAVTGPGTANASRITGTATIDTFTTVTAAGPDITGTVNFTVNGFQSSSTYSVPTLTIPQTGT